MTERPILFSGEMVRAIIAGRKTQTRRIVKPQPDRVLDGEAYWYIGGHRLRPTATNPLRCPYGQRGDILRVKESAWMWCEKRPNGKTRTGRDKWHYVPIVRAPIHYTADHPSKPEVAVLSPDTENSWEWRFKVGRFLPAWASRITLEIVSVRAEWLNDISEADAEAEGCEPQWEPGCSGRLMEGIGGFSHRPAGSAFANLWESINGPGSWEANPLVWRIEFRRVRC